MACAGDDNAASATSQDPNLSAISDSAPRDSSSPQDVNACGVFREHFVYSDWGLLDSDGAADAGLGSRQALEVSVAAEDASEAIAAAGEAFASTDAEELSAGIDQMLLACSTVVTP